MFEVLLFTGMRRILFLNLPLSNVIAVGVATLLNFLINRHWSFKATEKTSRSLALYLILLCLNTVFSTYAITLMVVQGFDEVIAKLITMVLITLWNFVLYRKVIFR